MSQPPKLTIITVVKDNLAALQKTYQSLSTQSWQGFLWLVQEGISTDGTAEWLRGLAYPNLRLHCEKDASIHDAMNKAIRKVPDGYCMFMNAGDTYHLPDVLERIMGALGEGAAPFAYGKYVIGGVPGFPERELGEKVGNAWMVFRGRVPCHQTMVIARSVFDSFGAYDDQLGIFADRDWILGYVKTPEWGRAIYLDFPIVHYDPAGRSFHRFIGKRNLYWAMLRKRGNFPERVVGIVGWARTAAYITLAKMLARTKGTSLSDP
jgi:glycosyltransferase involved in cell wall biosynthesis